MAHRRWVVRVIADEGTNLWFDNPLLECLRYAGIVRVHSPTPAGCQVFDILPPCRNPHDTKKWAEENAARMQTFRINAVAAPAAD
jgi:hypothetical protein